MFVSVRNRLVATVAGLSTTYWLLWVGTLVNRLGGFLAPFLSLYLTGERKIPIARAAFVVSLFGAGSFVGRIAGGELSDRVGRRPVLLLSFFATPAIVVAVGLVRPLSLLAAGTFLLGFFTDLYRPAVSAAIADIVPADKRIRAFGYLYWAVNLGAAIAPAVGGFMARENYFLLFAGDAVTTLLFGFIILFRFHETQPQSIRAEAAAKRIVAPRHRLTLLARDPALLLFAGLTFLFGLVYAQSGSTLPIAMGIHGVGPAGYGIVISLNGLLIVFLGISASRRAERWPRFPSIAVANVLLGAGFGLTMFAHALPLYALSVVIWTVGEIVNASVAPAVVADLATPDVQGLYQGIYGSAWGLAFFAGPALGGWVLSEFGGPVLWAGCLVIGIGAAGGYLLLGRKMDRPPTN
ncbi:MAG TPA: MFS transporter [Spirochaetia bacterium]|nr:MFS transporter [Spirochaetia bacterium]